MSKEVRLEPGEDVQVYAPTGETLTVGKNHATGATRVRVTASGTPTPPPDPDPVPDPIPTPTPSKGVLIGPAELAALPISGKAWDGVKSWAAKSDKWTLASQDSQASAVVLAKALVAARTGSGRADVIASLKAGMTTTPDRTLALGRELASGVIAADLIGVTETEVPGFKTWLAGIITKTFDGKTLISTANGRPNNWGTHAMGSLACVYVYLDNQHEIDWLHNIVAGWLGDRGKYAGFKYTAPLGWHADPTKPVGINPKGAAKSGHSIDGVLPDDQRRSGDFAWPPSKENYVWEALQGAVLAAWVLERAGRPVWALSDKALLRAVDWLYGPCQFPATGDDSNTPWIINRAYGTAFSKTTPTQPAKNIAFADWWAG